MRKLKSRELDGLLGEIETRLRPIRERLEETVARANVWMDDGNTGQSYGGSSSRSGHGDPVGKKIEAGRHDPITRDAYKLRDALLAAVRAVRDADAAMWGLRVLTPEEAKTLSESEQVQDERHQTLSAQCANPNCQRLVACTPQDRLRGGRCETCWRYKKRNAGEERPQFLCDLSKDAHTALALDESAMEEAS